MVNIGNNGRLTIIDNTGVKRVKNIFIYKSRVGKPGDIGVGSMTSVKPRRKLKRGGIVRFMIIQSRQIVRRSLGTYIRSLAFRGLLLKRTEFEPLANRLNGFFFLDLRFFEQFRGTSMTVYIVLLKIFLIDVIIILFLILINYESAFAFFSPLLSKFFFFFSANSIFRI